MKRGILLACSFALAAVLGTGCDSSSSNATPTGGGAAAKGEASTPTAPPVANPSPSAKKAKKQPLAPLGKLSGEG